MDIKSEAKKIRPMGLRKCMEELFDWHNTGILESGLVRDFAEDVVFKVTKDNQHKLQIAEGVLLKEAARRYLKGLD